MTPYRQPILPGQNGSDVRAVKDTLVALHIAGSGTMVLDNHAGVAFVAVLRTYQRQNALAADGKYGPATHQLLAPHFAAADVVRYKAAAIRKPTPPPGPPTAQAAAKRLLALHAEGKYRADNPGDLRDIQATAAGKAVWSQHGLYVHVDKRPLDALIWLIDFKGYKLGTYAICSDHHDDGLHGHAGGLAVDISSINNLGIGSSSVAVRKLTLAVAEALRGLPVDPTLVASRPRQLICGGYGNHRDAAISACCIPAADSFYGAVTMQQHTNHIHVGY